MKAFFKNLFDRRPKVNATIEMPTGSTDKIEFNGHAFMVDRILSTPIPMNYGFIPGTLAEDSDPLDIFVISDNLLRTGDKVDARIIGMFECLDQGVGDNKVVAIQQGAKVNQLNCIAQIANYLMNYKPGFEVKGFKYIKSTDELKKYAV